jgi:hypothetical protein
MPLQGPALPCHMQCPFPESPLFPSNASLESNVFGVRGMSIPENNGEKRKFPIPERLLIVKIIFAYWNKYKPTCQQKKLSLFPWFFIDDRISSNY